jgi:hypothetical protein
MPTQSGPRPFSAHKLGNGTRIFDVRPAPPEPRLLFGFWLGIDGTRVVDVTPGPRALLARSPSIDGRRVADVTPGRRPGIEVVGVGFWGQLRGHTKIPS